MNRYVIEEFYQDPALRQRLFGEARRERNRALRAGFAWLLEHAKALVAPRNTVRHPRWIERLG
jgi:hypothetical protein